MTATTQAPASSDRLYESVLQYLAKKYHSTVTQIESAISSGNPSLADQFINLITDGVHGVLNFRDMSQPNLF